MKKVLIPRHAKAGAIRPLRSAHMVSLAMLLLMPMSGLVRPTHAAPQDEETKQFIPDGTPKAETPTLNETVKGLGARHALLIGNHEYDNPVWEPVPTLPTELESLGEALTAAGFALYEGKIHYNLKLVDLETLMRGFVTKLGVGKSKRDDQLIIFFSGHGESVGGRGYIVPVGAPGTSPDEDAFVQGALPFSEIEAMAKRADARHLLFAFDSCFSGNVFDFKSGNELPVPPMPLEVARIAAGRARQFMTAGNAGEKVPKRSQFTPFFTRGLKGEADADRNGYLTAHELFAYLQPKVAAATKNTPRFGSLPGAEYEGDFVFRLPQRVAPPTPVSIANVNELFQGSALATADAGQQSKEVKKVQAALFQAQLYGGAVDGMISPATVAAIRTWQRQHNLPDTGHLDAATLATFSSPGEAEVTIGSATKTKPFINSLGIPFVPVSGNKLLFAAWETRVGDYLAFAEATKRPWKRPDFPQTNLHPVANVTWDDAVEFCHWLSVREGVTYRLPTANEWMFATGAGSGPEGFPLYPWGDEFPPAGVPANIADRAAWETMKKIKRGYLTEYEDGFAQTAPVGRMSANGYGISDLGGNVAEWSAASPAQNPGGNLEHECRGGSWQESEEIKLRTLTRQTKVAGGRGEMIGFRMVLEVPPPPPAKPDPRAEKVALRMLSLAASYAETGAGREDTPKLVSSFLALFGLPLKLGEGMMVPYCGAGVSYAATRSYLEIEAETEPDKPIDTEALRAALPKVRDLLFAPSPVIAVMKADAQKRGSWVGTQEVTPKPGWLIVFSRPGTGNHHVGIIESFQNDQITTIEFNTATETQRNGAVARRKRDLKYAIGYIKTY